MNSYRLMTTVFMRAARDDIRIKQLMELKELVPQQPVRWLPVSVMHMILKKGRQLAARLG